ncbi:uncharacterized protein L201_000678 [Kwoniella dendrophila CBS 6074]|uniref:HTH psq-type domain-containing protein n=1 Tax=Kwoniella dendrophila CBS 6074 TaxID=1295534 RepID=A0AAX4JKA5_9TREE
MKRSYTNVPSASSSPRPIRRPKLISTTESRATSICPSTSSSSSSSSSQLDDDNLGFVEDQNISLQKAKKRKLSQTINRLPSSDDITLVEESDDNLPPPPRKRIKSISPTKTPSNKYKITNKVKLGLLEEAMDLAYERLDFSRLSKKFSIPKNMLKDQFKSLSTDPNQLIKTNLRKSVLDIFNLNIEENMIPDVSHLSGLPLAILNRLNIQEEEEITNQAINPPTNNLARPINDEIDKNHRKRKRLLAK